MRIGIGLHKKCKAGEKQGANKAPILDCGSGERPRVVCEVRSDPRTYCFAP